MVWVVMLSAFYFLNRKWGNNYFTINISNTNT